MEKSLDQYPEILTVSHIREYLGIGRDMAYELFRIPNFPAIKYVGNRKKVRREDFSKWLEESTGYYQTQKI